MHLRTWLVFCRDWSHAVYEILCVLMLMLTLIIIESRLYIAAFITEMAVSKDLLCD